MEAALNSEGSAITTLDLNNLNVDPIEVLGRISEVRFTGEVIYDIDAGKKIKRVMVKLTWTELVRIAPLLCAAYGLQVNDETREQLSEDSPPDHIEDNQAPKGKMYRHRPPGSDCPRLHRITVEIKNGIFGKRI